MIKLLVLCGLFLLCGNAYALENCTAISLDSPKASDVRSPLERFQVDNNMVYICDKDIGSEECTYNSVILYNGKAVYCKDQDGVTDTWKEKDIPDCTDDDYNIRLKNKSIKYCGGFLVYSAFVEENGACVCKRSNCVNGTICRPNEQYMKCQAAIGRGEPAEWDTNNKECHCHDRGGVEYNWDKVGGKCVLKSSNIVANCKDEKGTTKNLGSTLFTDCVNSNITVIASPLSDTDNLKSGAKCPATCLSNGWNIQVNAESCVENYIPSEDEKKCIKKSGGESSTQRCVNSRSTTEGKACCYLPNSVATWDGKNCNCVISGMKFVERGGRGYCEPDGTTPGDSGNPNDETKPFQCSSEILSVINVWANSCRNNTAIMAVINQIKVLCASGKATQEEFNVLWTALLDLNPGQCGEQPGVVPPPSDDNGANGVANAKKRISKLHESLDSMRSGFKRSVWRDKDGDFNTSRLLSDSIAGVVLGTAGGLITSNVVKKNQVENGFEDIQCTIGGQVVATWGDEFRVGIQ